MSSVAAVLASAAADSALTVMSASEVSPSGEYAQHEVTRPVALACSGHMNGASRTTPSVTMAAIDIDRLPTKTYYTVQRSFQPVVASLEYDRDKWRSGEAMRVRVWAINDGWDAIPNARIDWRVVDQSGKQQVAGSLSAPMEADCSKQVGTAEWKTGAPGSYELRAAGKDAAGKVISENVFEFEVAP